MAGNLLRMLFTVTGHLPGEYDLHQVIRTGRAHCGSTETGAVDSGYAMACS